MNVAEEVTKDLNELKKLGTRVPQRALAYVKENEQEMRELREGGMKISEIADFVLLVCR